jgi:tyrosinase
MIWTIALLTTSLQQVLHGLVQTIASFWPESERPRYEAAARRFRIPYWDWAAPPPSGENVLPMSIGGSPYVDVNGPNGVQRIANPLFSYNFRPLDTSTFTSGPVSASFHRCPHLANGTQTVEYLDPNTQGSVDPRP